MTIANVETITGGTGADIVTLGGLLTNSIAIDLGSGSDKLTLAAGTNTGTVKNVETISGGTGSDTITLGAAAQNASIDLVSGNDTLTFGNFSNTATVANVGTVIGGTGADSVTLTGALTTSMSVNLTGGADKLTLSAAGGNAGTVKNVETLIGGTGNDAITLGTAVINGSVDLGSGSDTLKLANFTNRVSVTSTETVVGGAGDDTVILTGSNTSTVIGGGGMNFITGNAGADQFVLDQNGVGDISSILNFSTAKLDKIALDTTLSSTLGVNAYDLGGAALVDGTNLKAVADAAARLGTTEATTNSKGGFVYQQDTGELYYSGDGAFAGGGTLIGVIDGSSSVPWVYNASSFLQV